MICVYAKQHLTLYLTHMKIIISVVYDIPSTTVDTNTVFIDFYL